MQPRLITIIRESGNAFTEEGSFIGQVRRGPSPFLLGWYHHGFAIRATSWDALAFELSLAYRCEVDLIPATVALP